MHASVSAILVSMLLLIGCGGNDASPLPGETFDEKCQALVDRLGCNSSCEEDIEIASECEPLATELLDCLAQDLSQCLCEMDGDINCEGGSKPSEGPALCVQETKDVEACQRSAP